MPPATTDTENMYQRSGASGMSLQSQQHLSSAVSLHQMSKMSQRSRAQVYPKEQSKLNQSVPTPQQSGQKAVIIYTFPSASTKEMMPYLIKVDDHSYPRRLSLKDVKELCPRKGQQYRYFFKTAFEGVEVFEEIHDDAAAVPMLGGQKIVVECRGSDC